MLESPEPEAGGETLQAERAIVMQVLRDDHEERWARVELARVIYGFESAILDEAFARLRRDGVLLVENDYVRASRAARRLDELGLVGL
jgi:hypothetical protein